MNVFPCAVPRRVSVLGVGAMGRLHARVFAQLPQLFTLVGVYDPSGVAAREVGQTWSVPAFGDEAEAIAAADLVVIASPIEAHAGAARRALAGGRHVLVEKPVCATAAQAFALTRAVARDQRLFVGHSERFNPVIRALASLVRPEGVQSIRLRRTAVTTRHGGEHAALVSLGVHDLDLVAHLSASPVALRDVSHVDDDRADLVLVAARGAVAWVHVDRRAKERGRTIVVATKDAVYTGDLLMKTLSVRHGSGPETPCVLPREEPLVAQAAAISRALSGGTEAVATGVDGARALAIVEQATVRRGPRPDQASPPTL
jgi:UDP-N-acetylglucosamine 3-dehydrogenase